MILAADFGGTSIKLGLVRDGSVVGRARRDVEPGATMAGELEAVAGIWEELLSKEGHGAGDCRGVALGLPFICDVKATRVHGEFGKYRGAPEIDFGKWSGERLGLPLVLENDLRMALLGEWGAGAARGKHDAVMLAFGTGIGCAAISEGKLFRGANNRAGSLLGHSTVSLSDAATRCGNIGCAEDLASTATLEVRARAREDFAGSGLGAVERVDFEAVFRLAAGGDGCARGLLEESLKVWAAVAQNAVLAYDPEVVVLGGGILRSRDIVLPAMQEHMRRHMPCLPLEVPVVAAELGDDAALLGGEVFFNQSHSN